jgi:TolB-like protein
MTSRVAFVDIMVGVALCLISEQAQAADVCAELKVSEHVGTWAIAPFSCGKGSEEACAKLLHDVIACVKAAGRDVITPSGLTAAVDEAALKAAIASGDTRHLRKLGDMVPAKFLLMGEVNADGSSGALRVVAIEEGKVIAATRVSLKGGTQIIDEVPRDAVEVGLRRLADRLIEAYQPVSKGGAKYRRIAVLDFKETTELLKQKGLGTLISAELVTRFTKEHGMIVVERARINAVLREFELAQRGFVDEEKAPKLGKLVEADVVVLGSVQEAGDRFVIYAQMIDVESGVTLVAEQASVKAEGLITLASDALVLRSKSGAVFRSLLVPGWGQIYNRQPEKGYAFLAIVGGLGASAIVMQVLATVTAGEYALGKPGTDFDALVARTNAFMIARSSLLVGMGLVWAYNILDAYLNGATFDSAVAKSAAAGGAFTF